MLYFTIPLKSKAVSNDWQRVTECFRRTIDSVFGQTNDEFRVIVAAHEVPELAVAGDPRLEIIEVEFAPPSTYDEQMLDKGRKTHLTGARVAELGGGHVMKVDADDLVSRRLAQFVSEHPDDHGWVFEQGYEYVYDTGRLRRCPRFHRLCGTSSIVRYSPEELPSGPGDMDDPAAPERYHLRSSHATIGDLRAGVGKPLAALPFVGALYVVGTSENHSIASGNIGLKRRVMRRMTSSVELTPDLRKEFSLPAGG